ncbi:MAG: peptide deformylase [Flavobacteriales bacterium]|nr:peptide deformylase [Flavobacteriales bacterium]
MSSVLAFSNVIYKTQAKPISDSSHVEELVLQLRALQQNVRLPLVSAKHIGIDVQLFIVDLNYLQKEKEDFLGVFINPQIISEKAPLVSQLEEDLSLPKLSVSIERPKEIEISFLDEEFKEQTAVFSDLAARWILHGIDQLNGIYIVDRINKHRQRSVKGHLKNITEGKIEVNYQLEYE